ncbi:MAG: HD domain-containing protein [Candidatus Omnitrophica bacterium]|nr:HD domain-containing protein [Candidatus Omnitrophota bacterium]
MTDESLGRLQAKDRNLYLKFVTAFVFMFAIPFFLAVYLILALSRGGNSGFPPVYVGIIIFWMLASGIAGGVIIKRIIESITNLTKKVKNIYREQAGAEIGNFQKDDLQDLAVAFNRLTRDLENKISDLEISRSLTRELFQKIGYAITSAGKIEVLFRLIVQTMRKVLAAEAGFLTLYDPESEYMHLVAYSGPQKNLTENMQLPDNKGVIGFAIKGVKPMVIKKGGSQIINIPPEEEILSYNSILCVPVLEKKKVMGVLGVCDLKNTQKIETEDLFLLENLARQLATAVKNFELTKNLEETYYQTLLTLSRAVEAKDAYSAGHLERVSEYVGKVADKLNLNRETKRLLTGGAILHDLGKLGIRDEILKKEGKYTPEEYDIMKNHSVIGENILKPLRSMSKLSELVRYHHENYDGSGYPDGLRGEEIPLTSRILTIADIYDALTTDRPYRSASSQAEAIKMLRSYEGTKLDPKLTEIFISVLHDINMEKEKKGSGV